MPNYRAYTQPVSIDSIRQIQNQSRQKHERQWMIFKNKIKSKLYHHIMKQLRSRVKTIYRLNKQARKGKNYIRLTDYVFPFNNPLTYLCSGDQLEILQELVEEMTQTIQDLYGPEFIIEVQASPDKLSKVVTFVFYDIYAFYDDLDETTETNEFV